jgi:hypothetical protein
MIARALQLQDNPCCDFINAFPWWFFLLVHMALFAAGAFFAYRAFEGEDRGFGWGFTLFALAEVSYMTYHVNATQFLFAHTVSEVLDGLAFVVLFAAAVGQAVRTSRGTKREVGAVR